MAKVQTCSDHDPLELTCTDTNVHHTIFEKGGEGGSEG